MPTICYKDNSVYILLEGTNLRIKYENRLTKKGSPLVNGEPLIIFIS